MNTLIIGRLIGEKIYHDCPLKIPLFFGGSLDGLGVLVLVVCGMGSGYVCVGPQPFMKCCNNIGGDLVHINFSKELFILLFVVDLNK